MNFLSELKEQRWDDHRYYHHSRVNQSLHLLSALSFCFAYVMIWYNPIIAALVGWFVAMVPRQIGHFFFEPKGYDEVNQATHEHKEAIKVGYNLKRKVYLLLAWALAPLLLVLTPTLFGYFSAEENLSYLYRLSVLWIAVGIAGIIIRTVHLFFLKNVRSGLVWATKILTDPFHDIKIYHKAPLFLLKGEWIDPMHHQDEDTELQDIRA